MDPGMSVLETFVTLTDVRKGDMTQMTSTSRTWLARPLVLASTLAVLAGCGQAGDPSTTVPTESSSTPPASSPAAEPGDGAIQGTFDVEGHDLFLDCEGTSTPTVVLLHGVVMEPEDVAVGGVQSWDLPRDELGDTRTCAYDRRNVGQSEQVPGMSSAEDAIEDLHELLRAAGEKPPYVLAGYSFGGLLSLLYAGTYPDEVDGIVLVDATLPLEWDLDPPGIAEEVEKELNANAERIDFYGAGATTDAVLERLPEVPITYMIALQHDPYPKEWKGAYPGALRKFMRDLPEGRLEEYDTTHDMVYTIPGDVADQIQRVLRRVGA
jgi:pimeloyl-ACP methyl ester carboxylesterase